MLCETLTPSDEYGCVSGEGGLLNEEVDLWKVGGAVIERGRGVSGRAQI